MATTAAELLTAIDTAILRILTDGQEVVTIGGRRYTEANLDELRQLRAEVAPLAASQTRPSILDRAKFGVVRR